MKRYTQRMLRSVNETEKEYKNVVIGLCSLTNLQETACVLT